MQTMLLCAEESVAGYSATVALSFLLKTQSLLKQVTTGEPAQECCHKHWHKKSTLKYREVHLTAVSTVTLNGSERA